MMCRSSAEAQSTWPATAAIGTASKYQDMTLVWSKYFFFIRGLWVFCGFLGIFFTRLCHHVRELHYVILFPLYIIQACPSTDLLY